MVELDNLIFHMLKISTNWKNGKDVFLDKLAKLAHVNQNTTLRFFAQIENLSSIRSNVKLNVSQISPDVEAAFESVAIEQD